MTARLAQGKEHRPSKPTVDGSSPSARTTRPQDAATEALAEAWASIQGELSEFRACKASPARDEVDGYYCGYMTEAQEMQKRLKERGYVIRKARKSG